jgi:DNA-binding PadR family transcriptional regulator
MAQRSIPESPASSSDLLQGTLEMLILKTLALEAMHGYGVALRIEQISGGVFRANAGSLLPALSRMERAGHVRTEWRATESNRRANTTCSPQRAGARWFRKQNSGSGRSRPLRAFLKPNRRRNL